MQLAIQGQCCAQREPQWARGQMVWRVFPYGAPMFHAAAAGTLQASSARQCFVHGATHMIHLEDAPEARTAAAGQQSARVTAALQQWHQAAHTKRRKREHTAPTCCTPSSGATEGAWACCTFCTSATQTSWPVAAPAAPGTKQCRLQAGSSAVWEPHARCTRAQQSAAPARPPAGWCLAG